jgi:hypothetical protein
MAGKSQIIDVWDEVESLKRLLIYGFNELGLDVEKTATFAEKYSDAYVIKKVDDVLNSMLEWAKTSDEAYSFLLDRFGEHFGYPRINSTDRRDSHEFYDILTQTVDPIDILLYQKVESVVGSSENERWAVWYIRRFGTDLFFENSGDYRINTFKRMLKAGAIKL